MAQATDDNTTPLRLVDPIKLRARMSEAVERLLAALDALDAVTEDLEDTDEDDDTEQEPSLGATTAIDQAQRGVWASPWNWMDDLEDEHDGREPDVDDEDDDPGEDNGDAEDNGDTEAAVSIPAKAEAARVRVRAKRAGPSNGSDCVFVEVTGQRAGKYIVRPLRTLPEA